MTALVKHQEQRLTSLEEMQAFAEAAVRSKFYGFKTADEMLPLMIIAQSEGRSFASVVQEYDIISGKPSLKAEAMLARFQKSGGHIQWTELSDARCAAIFSHPQCSPVEIDWDMRRAQQAQIKNHMWAKYPRNMLKARVISDGVRTAFPACLGGMYTPEEVSEFAPARPQVSPPPARGQLAAPENAGQHETSREPTSFHDEVSNVPGGFRSLKTIEVDEEQRTDHTADPEWSTLSAQLGGNCECRADVLAWWDAHKKELKNRKPHFARAFHAQVVIPFAASFAQVVEWEEEDAGARG
jgi:hypothetical protein